MLRLRPPPPLPHPPSPAELRNGYEGLRSGGAASAFHVDGDSGRPVLWRVASDPVAGSKVGRCGEVWRRVSSDPVAGIEVGKCGEVWRSVSSDPVAGSEGGGAVLNRDLGGCALGC